MSDPHYDPNSINAVVSRIETNTKIILNRLDSHSARITAIEIKMWAWGGAVAVIAVAAPIIARHLWK